MRRLLGLRELVHDAVDAITQLVEDTQHASFERSLSAVARATGLVATTRAAEDVRRTFSAPVFSGIRRTNRGVRRIGDGVVSAIEAMAASVVRDDTAAPAALARVSASRTRAWPDLAQAALNAALGDFLHARANPLATEMALYTGRIASEGTPTSPEHATTSDRLCVFVHGLGATEHAWWMGAREYHGDADVSFGTRLRSELGYAALYVRYNTGRHISENGRELAALLSRLVTDASVPIREIVLIGHSMGGLLARSAAHYGRLQGHAWVDRLTHVVCIGSPHTGSFVEKSANVAASVLNAAPFAGTQVPAKILNARSAGIKDLRFGYLVDEDWTRSDPDALLTDDRNDIPLVPAVTYAFIAATYVRDVRHPMGTLLGDLLVRVPSASGQSGDRVRDVPFQIGCVLNGLSHLALLNHPDVYQQLVRVLRPPAVV